MESFPFWGPVLPVEPRKSQAYEAFVLEAYPRALGTPPAARSVSRASDSTIHQGVLCGIRYWRRLA